MAGLNSAQIRDKARSIGMDIPEDVVQQILKEAWDQSQWGADEEKVMQILQSYKPSGSQTSQSQTSQAQTGPEFMQGVLSEWDAYLAKLDKLGAEFDAKNPFNFDELQAKTAIETDYSPAYQDELNNYVRGIDLQRQSTKGEMSLFTELNRVTAGAERRNLDEAIRSSEEGYAGSGLFFSGARERGTGMQNIQGQEQAQTRESRFAFGQDKLGRQIQGLNLQEKSGRENIGTRKTTDIETELRNQRAEVLARREVERAQYTGDQRLISGMGDFVQRSFTPY